MADTFFGKTFHIRGEVTGGDCVILAGKFEGHMRVHRVELRAGAQVQGLIQAHALRIEADTRFRANVVIDPYFGPVSGHSNR